MKVNITIKDLDTDKLILSDRFLDVMKITTERNVIIDAASITRADAMMILLHTIGSYYDEISESAAMAQTFNTHTNNDE